MKATTPERAKLARDSREARRHSMSDSTLITDSQVAAINEARAVLNAIAHRAHMDHETQASGMIFALADSASADLFQLLNWFTAHAHGELSHEQLHGE